VIFAMMLVASSIGGIVRDDVVLGVLIHMRIDIALVLGLADERGTEIACLGFGFRVPLG
jgi:hypothetical protein